MKIKHASVRFPERGADDPGALPATLVRLEYDNALKRVEKRHATAMDGRRMEQLPGWRFSTN
jgi:hypothetical protein